MKKSKLKKQIEVECLNLYAIARRERWPYFCDHSDGYSAKLLAIETVIGMRPGDFAKSNGESPIEWEKAITESHWQQALDLLREMNLRGRAYIAKLLWTRNVAHGYGRPRQWRVYSLFAGITTPDEALALRERYSQMWRESFRRNEYFSERSLAVDTGWTFQDLIGTVWINVHCPAVDHVQYIGFDTWNDPQLVVDWRWGHLDKLGIWEKKRYIVTNAVRVDHLSEDVRRQWYKRVCDQLAKPNSLHQDSIKLLPLIGNFDEIAVEANLFPMQQMSLFGEVQS